MAAGPSRLWRILHSDLAAAWILVAAVAVAMVWANGSWAHTYAGTWLHPTHAGGRAFDGFTTVRDWVNGGLMAVFFLVVGLEIGRERRHGDLADLRTAVVPVAGALGGMVGAGLVYVVVVHGGPGASGWGIPMATDIAFALGALALLGRRVPAGLRVFLLTLAVADDIGSVAVLAVFYSSRTRPLALVAAAAVVVVLVVLRRRTRLPVAVVLGGGVVLWVLLAIGGVEPALAGVWAGLLVPGRTRTGGADPAERLERQVAPWSAFVVLPLFAVANAGITFHSGILAGAGAAGVFWGVGLARVFGKLARHHRGLPGGGPGRPRPPARGGAVAPPGRRCRGGRHRLHRAAAHRRAGLRAPAPAGGGGRARTVRRVGRRVRRRGRHPPLAVGGSGVGRAVARLRGRHRWRRGRAAHRLVTGGAVREVIRPWRRTVCCGQGRLPA